MGIRKEMETWEKQVKRFPKIIDFAQSVRGQVGNPLSLVGIADGYLSCCLLSRPTRIARMRRSVMNRLEKSRANNRTSHRSKSIRRIYTRIA